jgi:hypothetical protein
MYYDVQEKKSRADAGRFNILVGSSATKIEVQSRIVLGALTR